MYSITAPCGSFRMGLFWFIGKYVALIAYTCKSNCLYM